VIIMSAQNTFMTAVRASERGAYEYLPKPFDLKELIGIVGRALSEPKERARPAPKAEDFDSIPLVGRSPAMQEIYRVLARLMQTDLTVMITGESGTGKELVARALHDYGKRRNGPFVAINMAAIPRDLIESELFGHEKGAFTGATERKIGKFEAADKGTLMLDEIGEMSPKIQAKFLRVLEGHPFERVGGSQPIKVDVRVIAATNRDLEKAVAEGSFRRDLYFRLRVVEIFVPPLRKRPEDIIELANYFLDKYIAETGRKIRGFTPEALQCMKQYRWPGNVRELKNVIERAVVLTRSEYIDHDDLVLSTLRTAGDTDPGFYESSNGQGGPASLADVEKHHILETLNQTGWNKSRAAIILGIERSTLDRKIRRYDLVEERTHGD
jgi:DNA-binding NtrC family response regulator